MQATRMFYQFQSGHSFHDCHNSLLPQFRPPVRDGLIRTTSWPADYTIQNQMFTVDKLQNILLLYEHSKTCREDCGQINCKHMKQYLNHIIRPIGQCDPVCQSYKNLFSHNIGCIANTRAVDPGVRRSLDFLQNNHAKHRMQATFPQRSNLKRTLDHDASSGVLIQEGNVESPISFQSLNTEGKLKKDVGINHAKRRKINHDICTFDSKMSEGEVNQHFTLSQQVTFPQCSDLRRSLDHDACSEILTYVEPICTEVIEDHDHLFGLKNYTDKVKLEIKEMKELDAHNNKHSDLHGKVIEEKAGQPEIAYQTLYSDDIKTLKDPIQLSRLNMAKELPKTNLSNHIEQRIFTSLKKERQQRATTLGININEVPTAENLVVREVSSIDKTFEVEPLFREIFKAGTYPSEFNYKSKAIMLLQTIDESDVILFVMYVQEYGSECSEPNRRRVNISYIDSVKYFFPETRTVTGEALRTFVYHEFLIGYLDYCKKRLFTSCHIWASPPSKNDDYILYCHPNAQKIPKSDKLRQWYHKMIMKASNDNIVVEHTNLYDHFFVKEKEAQINITAGHLPYFDGDFLPEEINNQLSKDNEKPHANKNSNLSATRERMLRVAKRGASSITNEKDMLLMKNLGEVINPMKKDFMILNLYPICKCCYQTIMGEQWVCNTCKAYHICSGCHSFEEVLQDHSKAKKKHSFHKIKLEGSLGETSDEDRLIHCDIFETRLKLLDFCWDNNYQFGTLDQAQQSTKMILNYLHNWPSQTAARPPQSD